MTWAQRRKFIYISSIILFFLVVVGIPVFLYLYKPPNCFDNKQNQDELGIDCGGVCTLLCPTQYVPLNVLWTRFSRVNDGIYNVLAYIENPNLNAGTNNVDYVFKLYDKSGIILNERVGKAFAPANKVMAIFEADLFTGNQIPARVDFSFTSNAIWSKQDNIETGLSITNTEMLKIDTAPRLSFVITNKTIKQINKVEAIAIVYNLEGNTVAFSRTIIDALTPKESRSLSFNWPKPFEEAYSRTEIILKILK